MNAPQILVMVVALVLSPMVFILMRYPQFRRDPFRSSGPFSLAASGLCALSVFCLLAFLALRQ